MTTAPRTLMVLDDDRVVGRLVAAVAEAQGFRVEYFEHPADFLAAVRRDRPSHLMLDLVMPGLDGVEVLRRLAIDGCESALVLASGLGDKVLESARATADERGLQVLGLLPKPFRPRELAAVLARAPRERPCARPAPDPVCAAELARALAAGELSIVAQPKLDLATRRVVGAEVLARWQHPERGFIPPDAFIPLAEAHGLMHGLTHHVLGQALAWFARSPLRRRGSLSVNLATHCLHDVALADRIAEDCAAHGIAPGRLVLEITESSAMERTADCFDTLTRLRLKGFRLSLDDFGTGYSSLSQLVRLPLSEVKIDRSFVGRMLSSPDAARIVDATLRLARGMDLACVAEGVEDEAVLESLAAEGCEMAQGYFISRPMPCDAFDQWLAAREGEAGDDAGDEATAA